MTVIQMRPSRQNIRYYGVVTVAILTAMSATVPAYAAIDNTAFASGTFNGGAVNSTTDDATVPVVPLANELTIVKTVHVAPSTAAGTDTSNTDAGDTIVYRYTVTNSGNATATNISVTDAGPTFDGAAANGSFTGAITEVTGVGAGTGTAATLQPAETVVFEATYTLAQLDVLNAAGVTDGVDNVATATADGGTTSPPSTVAETTIPANPSLQIVKTAVLNDETTADNQAEVGETITYTYTVTNAGNVSITNVGIQDTHEGVLLAPAPGNEVITSAGPLNVSDIGTANDGTIDTFGPGAVATFTYVHTVTQQEVNDQ